MSDLPSYEQLNANFDWAIAERELGYRPGDVINIGWMCSDRLCRLGPAQKLALLWEDYQGNQKGTIKPFVIPPYVTPRPWAPATPLCWSSGMPIPSIS
jgi:hypothetical protein